MTSLHDILCAAQQKRHRRDNTPARQAARFWSRVERRDGGCWMWTASKSRGGYGQVHWHGKTARAPRVAYELVRGPIPVGMVLDHTCRNPPCVNPDHLDPVSQRVNTLRGESPPAHQARRTHCIRGHVLTGEHVRVYGNKRTCLACRKARGEAVSA